VAVLALLLGVAALAGPAAAADATPVGETPHFVFYGEHELTNAVQKVMAVAEERFARVCAGLGACDVLDGRITVWVAEDPQQFAAAFPDESPMAEWAAGVAFIGARRVVLRAHGTALFSLVETFDHEVAHILIHVLARGHRVPRWLNEGLAIWVSGEDVIGRLSAAHRAAITGNLLTLTELDEGFPSHGSRVPLAYAQSALFTRFLVGRYGPGALLNVVRDVGTGADFDAAFTRRFETSPDALAASWVATLEEESSPLLLFHDSSLMWFVMTLVFVLVGIRLNRQKKAAFARMDAEEEAAEERAEAARAFAELEAQRQSGEPPTLH
ncbi:MAG: hypothetical protein EP329_16255, partial [Deltaproteobacteria bacterium]